MATRIIEYAVPASAGILDQLRGRTVVPAEYKVAVQNAITASATPASSSALNTATSLVLVQSDEAVYIDVSPSPAVTANHYRIQAGNEQFFTVSPGASFLVQVRT